MILIDWKSPASHADFNKNFYSLVRNASRLYIYNDKLFGLAGKCVVKRNHKSRIVRALSVFKICWKHRRSKLVFISYDDVFLPFIQLFVKSIFCYEHNTTPEFISSNKHAVWQKLTFCTINRLCQSRSQLSILKEMGQRSYWLGVPVFETISSPSKGLDPKFIFVSERFLVSDVGKVIPYLYGEVLAKNSISRIGEIVFPKGLKLSLVRRISIPSDFLDAEALVVALDSSVRGTGWYNEAISYGIPLVITSLGQQQVFETTYPDYPYIKGDTLKSKEDLKALISQIKNFDNIKYVKDYMNDMKVRLDNILNYRKS